MKRARLFQCFTSLFYSLQIAAGDAEWQVAYEEYEMIKEVDELPIQAYSVVCNIVSIFKDVSQGAGECDIIKLKGNKESS